MWLAIGIVMMVLGILALFAGVPSSNGLYVAVGVLLLVLGILLVAAVSTDNIGGSDAWLQHHQLLIQPY